MPSFLSLNDLSKDSSVYRHILANAVQMSEVNVDMIILNWMAKVQTFAYDWNYGSTIGTQEKCYGICCHDC
jgi:hypothetical protein